MFKGGSDVVVDWIWNLCNMTFENNVVPEDLRSAVIVPLHNGKGEMIKCKSYRGISLLSVVGKTYADILVDRVRSVTGGLIDDEQEGFRAGRGFVDQIFTLIQIDEKLCGKNVVMWVLWISRSHMIGLIWRQYGRC